jgi:hypothetical protein
MRNLIKRVFRDRAVFQASYFALHDSLRSSGPTKGGRRHPFTGEDQTCSLSLVGKQAKTAKMRKEDMQRQMNTP